MSPLISSTSFTLRDGELRPAPAAAPSPSPSTSSDDRRSISSRVLAFRPSDRPGMGAPPEPPCIRRFKTQPRAAACAAGCAAAGCAAASCAKTRARDPRVRHPVARRPRGAFQPSRLAGRLYREERVRWKGVESALFRVRVERRFEAAHLEAGEHEPRVVVAVALPRRVVFLRRRRGTEVVVSTFSASDSLLINSAGMGTDSGAVAGDGFGRTHRFVELAQPSLESHPVHVRHQLQPVLNLEHQRRERVVQGFGLVRSSQRRRVRASCARAARG